MSGPRKVLDRVSPRRQTNWDARAAANFICGGAGGGLLLATGLAATLGEEDLRPLVVIALALVGTGLTAVWCEIGRPWRAFNVFRHASTSWMARESLIALVLFACGGAAILLERPAAFVAAGVVGVAYVYAQGRMLQANKGVPAFRQMSCVHMIVVTGLTEGVGLLAVASAHWPTLLTFAYLLAALLVLRYLAWRSYVATLRRVGVPTGALDAFRSIETGFVWAGHAAPAVLALAAGVGDIPLLAALAGALAAAAGAWFKYTLVCRASFTQGFALTRLPTRGGGEPGAGVKPGWTQT